MPRRLDCHVILVKCRGERSMKQHEEQKWQQMMEQLKYEEDFLGYIDLLQKFVRNYVIMLVSCDTPWGPNLTKERALALKELGLTADLFAKFRHSYAVVMDEGKVLFEKLSPSEKESVERTVTLGEDKIELLSAGFDTPQGKNAYIKINGNIVSTRARGLNFVVYDKEKKQVIDTVNFDVFAKDLIGKHLFGKEKLMQVYLEEHPGTILMCFNTPVFPKNRITLNEELIYRNKLTLSRILENPDKSHLATNRYYDVQGVKEVLSIPDEVSNADGARRMADKAGELVNIVDGHRITELQPQRKKRTIFLLGEENIFGVGVSDLHTTASFLQALCDQNMPEKEYVVENYGLYFKTPIKLKEWKELLQVLPVCPSGGDIVLWNTDRIPGVPFVDMANAIAEPRNLDLFFDKEHYTPHGHKLIADKLYEEILEQILKEELKQKEEFVSYLEKLQEIKDKYTIIVVSCQSPWGKFFGPERCEALHCLGLNMDLTHRKNHAYAAIIDTGTVLFEEVSSEPGGIVAQEVNLNGTKIAIKSWGEGSKEKTEVYVKINDVRQSGIGRGLFFVVYNKMSGAVLDRVTFDVETKQCVCMRESMKFESLLRYKKTHPHVVLIGYNQMSFPSEKHTEKEKYILEESISFMNIAKNVKDSDFTLHKYYSVEEIAEVCMIPKSYHDQKGLRHFEDITGKCVNIVGGHRVTKFQPENPKRTIFLIGGCNTFGICNVDAHTLASQLQEFFNQNHPEEAVCVQNYGYFLEEREDKQTNERLKLLESLPVKQGDIVLLDENVPNSPFVDTSKAAMEVRSYEVFADRRHYTPDGQRLYAEKIYEGLVKYDVLSLAKEAEKRTPPAKSPADFLDENETGELAEYKRMLIDFYNQLSVATEGESEQAVFGAIVMNCNPFTKGHRYLIDQALTKCDYLVVFVVEEDKSIFPFEDRFRLVAEGTEDLPNVILIPSGKFIISSLTFSEYFNKSELQDRVVDTSTDVLMFVREIAPCLHITKRFAGEEPFDAVTRQYNESMRKILPEYGMEFVEIPRAEAANEVISASRVRALLEKKEFEAIEKLVPETTYRYLVEKFR